MRISVWIMMMVLAWAPCTAGAATANVIQALNFGTWYITSNATTYSVSIATDGSYSHSPETVMIAPPRQGIYDVSGLTPNTALSITITQISPLDSGGGEQLDMDSFVSDSASTSDGAGHLSLTVGGRAVTSGSGSGYATGLFTGQLDIDFNM